MVFTQFTKSALKSRRQSRDLNRLGYEYVGESGGCLWELVRGCRQGHIIKDCIIASDGLGVFVKIEPKL